MFCYRNDSVNKWLENNPLKDKLLIRVKLVNAKLKKQY